MIIEQFRIVLCALSPEEVRAIIFRAILLMTTLAFAIVGFLFVQSVWKPLFLFLLLLCVFHLSEFFFMVISKPKSVTSQSFLLNHSAAFNLALVLAVVEYSLEAHFVPHIKKYLFISFVGLLICIIGEIIRKTAMLTAKTNYDHLVQCHKNGGHVLVTHGIYSWSRHPAYVGWFYWSAGTQIVCLNPVSFVFYVIASYLFFAERVEFEEKYLIDFFGQNYINYQRKVPTRLPLIKGYILHN